MLELTWKPVYVEPERQAVDLALREGDLGADEVRWRLVPSVRVYVKSTWKQKHKYNLLVSETLPTDLGSN